MVLLPRALAAILMTVLLSTSVHARDDEEREGGIIGTGIVGTIAQLGSIQVNGLRIRIDDAMPVSGAAVPMTAGDLRPGHTVAVVAAHDQDGWRARHIRAVLPLVGQVTALDNGTMTVLGTQVVIADREQDVHIGDWVAISGLWRDTAVFASRIDRLEGGNHTARLSGSYLGLDRHGNILVGSSVVTGVEPRHLQPGDLVRVSGQAEPGGIAAIQMETGLFDTPVEIVQVQGYFSSPLPGGLYTILGSGLVAYTGQSEMIDTRIRVIQCGKSGLLYEDRDSDLLTGLTC